MGYIHRKRIFQVIKYGWKDSEEIAREKDVKQLRLFIFGDIISCFRHHYVFSYQYKANKMWNMPKEEKEILCDKLGASNRKRDRWIDHHYKDIVFLNKYNKFKYETSPKLSQKRYKAYRKHSLFK